MKISGRIKISNLYLVFYFCFCFLYIINESLLPLNGKVVKLSEILCAIGALAVVLYKGAIPKKMAACIAIAFPLMLWAGYQSGDIQYSLVPFFLAGAYVADRRQIVKACLYADVMAYGVVTALSIGGILPDYTYNHNLVVTAHTYGFNYYTWPHTIVTFSTIYYIFLRGKKIKWIEIMLIAGINIVAFNVYTTRLPLIIGFVSLVLFVLFVKRDSIQIDGKLMVKVATIMFPVVFLGLLYISASYDPNNKFSLGMDLLLNSRVRYTNEGITRYGIQLLGSKMNMVGQYKVTYLGYSRNELFFVDSGLMYSLLEFGVLYSGFVISLFSIISRTAAKQNDKVLFVLCFAVLLYAMVNDVLIKIAYNPLIIIAIPVIFREFEKKRQRDQ